MTTITDTDYRKWCQLIDEREAVVQAWAEAVDQPDLSEYEVPLVRLTSDWGPTHVHGGWVAQHTASGSAIWCCGGCWYTPPVSCPIPELGGRSTFDFCHDGL